MLNSLSRGNGVGAYLSENYSKLFDITKMDYQISAYSSQNRVIINVYCSSRANHTDFIKDIFDYIKNNLSGDEETIICGDFNIHYSEDSNNIVISKMKENKFQQLINKATHIKGNIIDHVYVRNINYKCKVVHQSISYFDHDILYLVRQ